MQLGRRNLQFFSSSPLLRCEMLETHPPFHRADFLSGTDYGRDRLIRARCWLGWLRHLPALSCDPRTIHARNFAVASDSRSGLIMGDFVSGRVSDHEGRGAGKSTTPGGREKNACFFGRNKDGSPKRFLKGSTNPGYSCRLQSKEHDQAYPTKQEPGSNENCAEQKTFAKVVEPGGCE